MSTVQKKQTNLREKLAELLDFRKMRDRLSGLGLYIGKDRTNTDENLLVRGGANVDDLQIGEIAALVGGTAVDVFVYDTSRDSDGGKWRERTQHTSWYNEELNTATRGARREFPAVAVIVAEANKVTIYDGDDPDLGMWMVFEQISWGSIIFSCVTFINGKLVIGSGSGYTDICFIKERMSKIHPAAEYTGDYIWNELLYNPPVVVERPGLGIVHNAINDVAMTILPNAPIDDDTGLPVPTIAVATDGGASVIKDDGTVVDFTTTQVVEKIQINNTHIYFRIIEGSNSYVGGMLIPVQDASFTGNMGPESFRFNNSGWSSAFSYTGSAIIDDIQTNDSNVLNIGSSQFLAKITNDHFAGHKDLGSQCYITSKYNTGWMPGDIKLATLSDTTVENIGVNSDELSKLTQGSATNANATWAVVDDTNISVSNYAGLSYFTIAFAEDLIVGNIYEGELIVSNFSGPLDSIGFASQINKGIGSNIRLGSNGSIKFTFKHQGDDVKLFTAGGTGDVEISIRATTELITNGDFSTDVSASDGQTSGGWTSQSAVLSVNTSQQLVIDDDNNDSVAGRAYKTFQTIPGQKYVTAFDKISTSGSNGNVYISNNSSYGTNLGEIIGISAGSYSITFTATNALTYIILSCESTAGGSATFDNISVRPAVDDRSVNNNGLQIIGEINKAPVAPGADLVAYSGFSANDYLVQPYNADLDFGTGDFCVMGWVNIGINSTQRICGKNSSTSTNRFTVYFEDNNLKFYTNNSGNSSDYRLALQGLSLDTWSHFVARRKDGLISMFINGIEGTSYSAAGSSLADLSCESPLYVGLENFGGNNDSPLIDGKLALLRISKTAPTDAQIAKIYRDEKALFQDGAQATLYGTSDAVTALAYDEKTELLHVGTSSGRSDFSGLRRINNTTTAVTTSISAHNNLIAEQ